MYKNNKLDYIDTIIPKGMNVDNTKEIARTLGIPLNMAERYFNRKCKECGKNLSALEVSMFLITQGRYERQLHDIRKYLCTEHLAEFMNITEDEYYKLVQEKTIGGCQYL